MELEKEIEKAQKKLTDAILESEKAKIRYDTQLIILESHRRSVSDMNDQNKKLLDELTKTQSKVQELNNELNTLINKSANQ